MLARAPATLSTPRWCFARICALQVSSALCSDDTAIWRFAESQRSDEHMDTSMEAVDELQSEEPPDLALAVDSKDQDAHELALPSKKAREDTTAVRSGRAKKVESKARTAWRGDKLRPAFGLKKHGPSRHRQGGVGTAAMHRVDASRATRVDGVRCSSKPCLDQSQRRPWSQNPDPPSCPLPCQVLPHHLCVRERDQGQGQGRNREAARKGARRQQRCGHRATISVAG